MKTNIREGMYVTWEGQAGEVRHAIINNYPDEGILARVVLSTHLPWGGVIYGGGGGSTDP